MLALREYDLNNRSRIDFAIVRQVASDVLAVAKPLQLFRIVQQPSRRDDLFKLGQLAPLFSNLGAQGIGIR